MNRKYLIHTGILVCITFMFPELPVKGLQFIGDSIGGFFSGLSPHIKGSVKDFFNPFS